MDWKGVGEKLIVAIVAGAVLGGAGWMLGRATRFQFSELSITVSVFQ
jgi:hypothetical protein